MIGVGQKARGRNRAPSFSEILRRQHSVIHVLNEPVGKPIVLSVFAVVPVIEQGVPDQFFKYCGVFKREVGNVRKANHRDRAAQRAIHIRN
ncbi:MAG: hypothetical protein DMG13_03175 [Acidobacteria bacterium]|nr:MAG: hypothetical protein DMG13_03175 [Acidobacteriota bacterium]